MTSLQPLAQLLNASPAVLRDQAASRRELLLQLVTRLRDAASPSAAVDALRAHGAHLLELGLHDEAARLNAFARAVLADVTRFADEAVELEHRTVPLLAPK